MLVPIKFAAIGECMLELSHTSPQQLNLNFAGDTLNVATYLARYAADVNVHVEYVTAIGTDPYSDMMINMWQEEKIGHQYIARIPNLLPGLYLIRTNEMGERTFYFYRSQSAARQLFYTPEIEQTCEALLHYDYLYISGICLGILDAPSRAKLLSTIIKAKELGTIIGFDTNYRPTLWANRLAAQNAINEVLPYVDMALTTFSDEQALFDDKRPEDTIARLHHAGVGEVVVKRGEDPCYVSLKQGEQFQVPALKVSQIVDTTSAGDSFNAGYLAARINGSSPQQAAEYGHRLASVVIAHRGAIIPKTAMPKLF